MEMVVTTLGGWILHMDFAGPFKGKMILITIDSYSKWIEAFPTKLSTSATDMELYLLSSEVVVMDNGSCFISEEFKPYSKMASNILHLRHITLLQMVWQNVLFKL